jgi:hypothetical protein
MSVLTIATRRTIPEDGILHSRWREPTILQLLGELINFTSVINWHIYSYKTTKLSTSFWEELIAYFRFNRHGPQRKQQSFYCNMCIFYRGNVLTELLLVNDGGCTYRNINLWEICRLLGCDAVWLCKKRHF